MAGCPAAGDAGLLQRDARVEQVIEDDGEGVDRIALLRGIRWFVAGQVEGVEDAGLVFLGEVWKLPCEAIALRKIAETMV